MRESVGSILFVGVSVEVEFVHVRSLLEINLHVVYS